VKWGSVRQWPENGSARRVQLGFESKPSIRQVNFSTKGEGMAGHESHGIPGRWARPPERARPTRPNIQKKSEELTNDGKSMPKGCSAGFSRNLSITCKRGGASEKESYPDHFGPIPAQGEPFGGVTA